MMSAYIWRECVSKTITLTARIITEETIGNAMPCCRCLPAAHCCIGLL